MNDFFNTIPNSTNNIVTLLLVFVALFVVLMFTSKFVFKKLKKIARKTQNHIDDYIVNLFQSPVAFILFSVLLMVFAPHFINHFSSLAFLKDLSNILFTLSIGWLVIQSARAISKYFQNKYNMDAEDNLLARSRITQIRMFENITIFLLAIIFIAIALLTIDGAENVGKSILASAGIIGVLVGLAAQKSMGQVLSGIQIALTQPVKIDDVVIIEGEFGRIEEIKLTYIVVKIWDERRLVVPVDYFLNNPIENWTNKTSEIVGKIYLHVAYTLPLEPLRKKLAELVKDNKNWDGRVQGIQVTGTKEWYKEIRITASSSNSSENWNLQVEIREKMIDFINANYPNSFASVQMNNKGLLLN